MDWKKASLSLACTGFVSLFTIYSMSTAVQAADWLITPGIEISETYLDNVTLAPPGEEEHDYITQVNPILAIQGQGRRADFDIKYRMQNLFYARNSDENTTFHQLATDVNTELLGDLFFLDVTGSYQQALISPEGRTSSDNLSITEDLTDVGAYSLSPYIVRRLGSSLLAELRYAYERVDYSEDEASTADSETQRIQAILSSNPFAKRLAEGASRNRFEKRGGIDLLRINERQVEDARAFQKGDQANDFFQTDASRAARSNNQRDALARVARRSPSSPLQWNLNFQREEIDSDDDDDDSQFEEIALDVSYLLNADLALLTGIGYEDNEFGQSGGDESEGIFWDIGAAWSPFRRLFLEATVGERFFGTTYSFALRHETRKTTSEILYNEKFTTTGQTILENPVFSDDISDGEIPISDDELVVEVPLPSVDTEVFLRKRLTADISYATAKSIFGFEVYNETRDFQVSGEDEQVFGTSISWSWKPTVRTKSLLYFQWENQDLTEGEEQEDWKIGLRLTRKIHRDLNGALEYRYLQRDASEAEDDYELNDITASVRIQF